MCISDFSSCELISLASSLAIFLGQNFSNDDVAILAAFFTALGDNLAIIATVPFNNCENNSNK